MPKNLFLFCIQKRDLWETVSIIRRYFWK